MGALVPTIPTRAGTADPGNGVAATDTIARAVSGPNGCLLEIINGNAATDNMTISDASLTTTGGAAAAIAPAIPTAQNRIFKIHNDQFDPVTQVVTITHSVQTTVSYKLYPI